MREERSQLIQEKTVVLLILTRQTMIARIHAVRTYPRGVSANGRVRHGGGWGSFSHGNLSVHSALARENALFCFTDASLFLKNPFQ